MEDDNYLSAIFTKEEIKQAVWSCDGHKSPRSNGFNFTFIRKFWTTIKDEVFLLVEEFFCKSILPKCVSSSFIALNPKRDNPQKVSDYRSISFIGVIHKLISKLLAARLKKVIGSLISPTRSTFIANRQILDRVLAISKIVDLAKKRGDDCLILKVDFEKAYDSVNWGFIKYLLTRMGFCDKWLGWMPACVFKGYVLVLINGSTSEEVRLEKGLRKGDPLAPFLFLIVTEGLSILMDRAVELGRYSGYSFQESYCISHLQYANDTLLASKVSFDNL